VNRLGQTRPTTVYHMVIKDSIEESVHRVSTAPLTQTGGFGEGGGAVKAARGGRMSLAEVEDLFDLPPRFNVQSP